MREGTHPGLRPPLPRRVMYIVSIALYGPSARALTRPYGPPSPRGRGEKKSLSLWERGWGEGQTATQVHLHHTSQEGIKKAPLLGRMMHIVA